MLLGRQQAARFVLSLSPPARQTGPEGSRPPAPGIFFRVPCSRYQVPLFLPTGPEGAGYHLCGRACANCTEIPSNSPGYSSVSVTACHQCSNGKPDYPAKDEE